MLLTHIPITSRARAHRPSCTAEISCGTARRMFSTPQQDSRCTLNCPEAVSYSGPGVVLRNDGVKGKTRNAWAVGPPPAVLRPTAWVRRLEGEEHWASRGDSRGQPGPSRAEGRVRPLPVPGARAATCRPPSPATARAETPASLGLSCFVPFANYFTVFPVFQTPTGPGISQHSHDIQYVLSDFVR